MLFREDAALVAALVGILGYALVQTTSWRMKHDLPMMMYQAYLTNELGLAPYRDFFDMNMPGTYATYRFIGRVFGYGDLAIRFADWTWLALVWATTLAFLRGFPWRVRLAGLGLFSLVYLRLGAGLTLQREYLAMPLLALGVAAAFASLPIRWRAVLAGLAFGTASTFKPHLVIGALPVAAYLAWEVARETPRGARARAVAPVFAWGALGLAVPVLVMVTWLVANGLWSPFLRSLQYLVYYGQLDGDHVVVSPGDRPQLLFERTLRFGGHFALLLAAGFGFYVATTASDLSSEMRRRVGLVAGMAGVYVLYPAGSGQFWNYHWLPMVYFACMCAALLVSPVPSGSAALAPVVPRIAFALFVITLADVPSGLRPFRSGTLRVTADGRPDKIAAFLGEHLAPGDAVQPFDWVAGGVVQGMLLAGARPATPYLYTFHFYHHVSTPFIQGIQADFMERLRADPPAFVVASDALWPFVSGRDTEEEFPAFDAWLDENYEAALRAESLIVWERSDHLLARGGTPVEPLEDALGDTGELSYNPLDFLHALPGRDAPHDPPPRQDDGTPDDWTVPDEGGEIEVQ